MTYDSVAIVDFVAIQICVTKNKKRGIGAYCI